MALASSKVRPWVVNIDTVERAHAPEADKIIASARDRTNSASAELAASQQWTRNIIVSVGCAAVLLGSSSAGGSAAASPAAPWARAGDEAARRRDTRPRLPATHAKTSLATWRAPPSYFRDTGD